VNSTATTYLGWQDCVYNQTNTSATVADTPATENTSDTEVVAPTVPDTSVITPPTDTVIDIINSSENESITHTENSTSISGKVILGDYEIENLILVAIIVIVCAGILLLISRIRKRSISVKRTMQKSRSKKRR